MGAVLSDSSAAVRRAAELLRQGHLVALPTETVYGLGADASNAAAVSRVFSVKGRPTNHPLIVHLASGDELSRWASIVPREASLLAANFWPGPLTLVLPVRSDITSGVTGGLATIALRVPQHPLTLAVLRELNGGVAAPSANRFGKVSPTTAEHVQRDLGSDVDYVLDGGPCDIGVESTVVDLSAGAPCVLRPGAVTAQALEQVLGVAVAEAAEGPVKAPGQLPSHYAPRAQVVLVSADAAEPTLAQFRAEGRRAELLFAQSSDELVMARELYRRMRRLDEQGCQVIVAVLPGPSGVGAAVADRLRRAAAPRPAY